MRSIAQGRRVAMVIMDLAVVGGVFSEPRQPCLLQYAVGERKMSSLLAYRLVEKNFRSQGDLLVF